MRALVAFLLVSGVASAREEENPEADAERDTLIEKIANDQNYEASVKRLKELVLERDKRIATSRAAVEAERAKRDEEIRQQKERNRIREEYEKSADYAVANHCTVAVDPRNPVKGPNDSYHVDWGKITRREQTRLPPKNELDEGDPVLMFEVKTVTGTYQFDAARFGHDRNHPFEGKVGDFVIFCKGSDRGDKIPKGWGPRVVDYGVAVHAAGPPLIAKKTRWSYIVPVTDNFMRWAIRDVKWKLPDEAFVVSHVEVVKDLGGGRYEIYGDRELTWVLEVPPTVKNREVLMPGHSAWVIAGQHRFDRGLHKLVLVAEDIEARYVMDPK
jgi:hypothetical protein